MTPYQKGRSQEKTKFLYYFAIDRSKITPNSMEDLLEEHGFKKHKHEPNAFDFIMSIRLESQYNPSKFASDLIKKYPDKIMEIKVKQP